jgi:ribulose-5-phosphate 4-epimerase/fuculose-1-phosphate aldolase
MVNKSTSRRSSHGPDEQIIKALKRKLILANKVLDYERWCTPFGHISVRIPDTETFMITRSVAPGMVTNTDDILVCDLNGKVIQGKYPNTYGEVVMHSPVYRKRKEINSVIHSHPDHVIALSMAGNTLEPSNLFFLIFGPQPIAMYKKMCYIDKPELGEEVCDLLGPNKAVILKGHGALVVGRSIEDAIYLAWVLETSARYQWMAKAIGKIDSATEEEKTELIDFHKRWEKKWYTASRVWEYYEFLLKNDSAS